MALVKYNNNSISAVTSTASMPSGALTLIKTLTASSSSTVDFVDGSSDVILDNTYPIYMFKFINMHPSGSSGSGGDGAEFMFQANASGGSGFNETVMTTFFLALHNEAGGTTNFLYEGDHDSAQGTSYTELHGQNSNDSDHGMCGELFLFNPSSTIFVKHFFGRFSGISSGNFERDDYPAGYFNTTSAIDEISFKFSSGNIDSGKIKLYGIKDS
nr:hypothetical protein [uncultured Mediterranean phage uvMED]